MLLAAACEPAMLVFTPPPIGREILLVAGCIMGFVDGA